AYAIAQFPAGFLLQGRSSERRCRRTFTGLYLYIANGIAGANTGLKELLCVFAVVVSFAFSLKTDLLSCGIIGGKYGFKFKTALGIEGVDFSFSFRDQPYCYTLYPACAQVVFYAYFAP